MARRSRTRGKSDPNPIRRAVCCAVEQLEARRMLSTAVYNGALNGKFVFTSGGHGWQWSSTLNRYATDRGDNQEIVEDFGNQEQQTAYADYLLRAGATVIPMRPVGRQLNEVIVDNDSAGATFTGSWSNSSSTKYYDEDYGAGVDAIPYRFASTTAGSETAVATYTPNIPSAGMYPVYTWVLRGTDRTSQLYRINHSGGTQEIRVDHSKVGSGWVYLGTYHFNSGSSVADGSVQISNNGTASKVVIADAIRFGNGMGDSTVSGGPSVSGYPREDENSWHWIARSVGVGTTLATAIGSGVNNVSAPSNFAQYMFAGTFGEGLYVGIHSNAGGGRSARGLIDTDTADRTPHQADLATYLGRQINQDMQALNGTFEYNWGTGTTHTFTGQFGELDLGASAEMDATIIEVAFHDSVEDAAIMRDPKGRDQIARSMLQGTIEYFQNWGGVASTTSLPTAPVNVRAASAASGQVTVSWAAGPSTPAAVYGAAPTGYQIYTSTDGYGFDLAATVGAVTSTTLTGLAVGTPLYIKVTATNAGGESLASEVMTALPGGGAKEVLIVSGFDRYERSQNFRYAYAHTGDLLVDRVWSRYNNSFDYLVNVHSAIHASKPGTNVDSTSNEAVISGAVNLGDYDSVIWILGNESTANDTFNATEQTKVEQFIAAGGDLFVSGSEIAWDLDQQNNGRSFYETTLKGNYVADAAGTNTATVAAGGIFNSLSNLAFSSGSPSAGAGAYSTLDTQMYNVNSADVIAAQSGAVVALNYNNGSGAAGIQVTGTGGRGNVVMFGFPFETMTNATRRSEAMGRILDFFGPAPAPGTPNLANAQDSGISNTDDRTKFNNSSPALAMLFQVTGTISGATVRLYSGATVIGSAVASGTTTVITTDGATTLSDGLRLITATQQEPSEPESPASLALNLTVDTAAPAAPGASSVSSNATSVTLDWANNGEGDLWGYNVLRSTTSGGPYSQINGSVVTVSNYTDSTVVAGTTYYYVVRAIDTAANESGNSPQATGTPLVPTSSEPFDVTLHVTSDTGASSSDNVTRYNNVNSTLTFVVSGTVAGAMVRVYADGTQIGSATATGSVTNVQTDFVTPLSDGNRSITATQTEVGLTESTPCDPLTITVDTVAQASVPDLASASDTGVSNTDNITNLTTLTFNGTVETNATLMLLVDDSPINTDSDGNATYSFTETVTDSPHDVKAQVTDLAGNTLTTAVLSVVIDPAGPTAAMNTIPPDPAPGSASLDFVVTYTDYYGTIDATSLDDNDILITGPNGYSQNAQFISLSGSDATYRIAAPGGAWNFADSGDYSFDQVANQVKDVAGNAAPAAMIGGLLIGVDFAWVDNANTLHIESGPSNPSWLLTVNGSSLDVNNDDDVLSFPLASFNEIEVFGNASDNILGIEGTFSEPLTYHGGGGSNDELVVLDGTFTLGSDFGVEAPDLTVFVVGGASAVFDASQHVRQLIVHGDLTVTPGGAKVIVTENLIVTGLIDLGDNDMIWDYDGASPIGSWSGTSYTGAIGLVQSGKGEGLWDGTTGVKTTMTDATTSVLTTVAVADAVDALSMSPGDTALFSGETIDATCILFKYTWGGDADLNGELNGDDYFRIDSNILQNGSIFGFHNGDFDYNGELNGDDYFAIDSNIIAASGIIL